MCSRCSVPLHKAGYKERQARNSDRMFTGYWYKNKLLNKDPWLICRLKHLLMHRIGDISKNQVSSCGKNKNNLIHGIVPVFARKLRSPVITRTVSSCFFNSSDRMRIKSVSLSYVHAAAVNRQPKNIKSLI